MTVSSLSGIDEDYFFADLVFYHRILKCHVIVELKIDKFHHEYASQLNMYLNYFKAEVMQPDDNHLSVFCFALKREIH